MNRIYPHLSEMIAELEYAETGITGGVGVITGNFTLSKANDLAIQLRSGALPVSVEVVLASKRWKITPTEG